MTPLLQPIAATRPGRLGTAIALVALLGGCAATDPLTSENTWHTTGANEANIAAEVVNPADLQRGQEAVGGTDGELSAAAVQRLRSGHPKQLPDSGISDLQIQSAPTTPAAP